jgi:hypothetical protein
MIQLVHVLLLILLWGFCFLSTLIKKHRTHRWPIASLAANYRKEVMQGAPSLFVWSDHACCGYKFLEVMWCSYYLGTNPRSIVLRGRISQCGGKGEQCR